MNCLNSFLVENKATNAKVVTKVDIRVRVKKVSAKKLLLFVKAYEKRLPSLLLSRLPGRGFWHQL